MADKSKPEEIEDTDLDATSGGFSPDMKIRMASTPGGLDMQRVMGVRVEGNPVGGVRKTGIRQTGIRETAVRKVGIRIEGVRKKG
ncbi:MAG: hypothetical protein AAF293_06580 [Pseudomonadota bacterium]